MKNKLCWVCHIVSINELCWYECSFTSSDSGVIGHLSAEPPSGSSVLVVIGVGLLSWRERESQLEVGLTNRFEFVDQALVEPDQLVWSQPTYGHGRVAQAWMPKWSWEELISNLSSFAIVGAISEPISIHWDGPHRSRSGEFVLCFGPDSLSAKMERLGESTEIDQQTLTGARFNLRTGTFHGAHLPSPSLQAVWKRHSILAFGVATLVIHVLVAVLSSNLSRQVNQSQEWPAMQWLEKMAESKALMGNIESLRAMQFGGRMEVRMKDSSTGAALGVIQEIVGPEYTVSYPDSDYIVVERNR